MQKILSPELTPEIIEADKERFKLVFGEDERYPGPNYDIVHFSNMSPDILSVLIDKGYISLEHSFNCSPTVGDFVSFANAVRDTEREGNPYKVGFHGYVIGPARRDSRIEIEGVLVEGDGASRDAELILSFVTNFRHADEFDIYDDSLYCWYD